jgi:translin
VCTGKLITTAGTAGMQSLEQIRKSLREMDKRFSDQLAKRDKILKESRDIISASSRAIINVHTRKEADAEKELSSARALLSDLKGSSDGSVSRYLVAPESEYVEASAVLALAKGKEVPSMASLGASPEAYLLGLLDTIGELKRLVLDSVLQRKLSKARNYFDVMEELYSLCSPMAVYDHVANGARRKIDVARMLVEDTRGLLAEEMGREAVGRSMASLEKKLSGRSSGR